MKPVPDNSRFRRSHKLHPPCHRRALLSSSVMVEPVRHRLQPYLHFGVGPDRLCRRRAPHDGVVKVVEIPLLALLAEIYSRGEEVVVLGRLRSVLSRRHRSYDGHPVGPTEKAELITAIAEAAAHSPVESEDHEQLFLGRGSVGSGREAVQEDHVGGGGLAGGGRVAGRGSVQRSRQQQRLKWRNR